MPSSPARRARRLIARIESTAVARHDAWIETGQPWRTGRLTVELRHLFGAKRQQTTGIGEPFNRPPGKTAEDDIIAARSSRKREGEVPPVRTGR